MIGLMATPLPAEEEELPLNFSVTAVNMSNVDPRGQARLQIRVNRWSTDEERAKLMEALAAQTGQARDRTLADTLFGKEAVGTIRECFPSAEVGHLRGSIYWVLTRGR